MIRTFVDSGVLLVAARSVSRDRERALQILEDPERVFLTSPFVYLEVVPKAVFHEKSLERSFYEEFFRVAESFRDLSRIESTARSEAAKFGLSAMDALHVATAKLSQADEFLTTERPGKPLYRTSLVQVVYLFA